MIEERDIRLRPHRLRRHPKDESKAWSKAFKGLMRIVRMTASASGGQLRAGPTGFGLSGAHHHHSVRQRCAVRLTYSPNRIRGQWRAHGRYVARESATSAAGPQGAGFTAGAEGIDLAQTLDRWQQAGDPRVFKLIVSPEFGERVDLRRLVCELMTQIEQDQGVPLEWVAAVHFNTEHPHVHIALRGLADGRPLRLERDYIKHGIRLHAEALCTAQLGFRTQADALEAERRDIDQPRFTGLDRQIRGASVISDHDFAVTVQSPDSCAGDWRRIRQHYLQARLRVLEKMGLAHSEGANTWRLRTDFEAVLRTMQRMNDRQKMIAAHARMLSDARMPINYLPVNELTYVEGRVVGHAAHDAAGVTHMIVEGIDAKIHLVPHTEAIQSARHRNLLKPNSFVRLRRKPLGWRNEIGIEDFGDADLYLKSERFRQSVARQQAPPEQGPWGGWVGRYQTALQEVMIHSRHRAPRRER